MGEDVCSWLRQWLLKLRKDSEEAAMVTQALALIEDLLEFRASYQKELDRKNEIIAEREAERDRLESQIHSLRQDFNYPYLKGKA